MTKIWIKHENTVADIDGLVKWFHDGGTQFAPTMKQIKLAYDAPNFFRNTKFIEDSLFVIRKMQKTPDMKVIVFINDTGTKDKKTFLKKIAKLKSNEIETGLDIKACVGDIMIGDTVEDISNFRGIRILIDPQKITQPKASTCDYVVKSWADIDRILEYNLEELKRIEKRGNWYD